jgi:uncharacterized protein YkwD
MGWVTARTTEMPALLLPPGRHYRRRRRVVGILLGLLVFAMVATTAVFSSSLLHWLRVDPPPAGPPLASGLPTETASPSPSAPQLGPSEEDTPSPTPSVGNTFAVTPLPVTTPAKTPGVVRVPPAPTPMVDLENEVLRQTNAARTANKCPPLTMDKRLLAAARLHSADMAQNDYFSHTGLDGEGPDARMKAAGYDVSGGWAENIAEGYPTPDAVMTAWLSSPGHKQNIVNCAMKSMGVGIAAGAHGALYWTQDFGGR